MIKYEGTRIRKISFWDWFLHLFGVHVVRTSALERNYCRICGKEFTNKELEKEKIKWGF